jgi:hypothetical protein
LAVAPPPACTLPTGTVLTWIVVATGRSVVWVTGADEPDWRRWWTVRWTGVGRALAFGVGAGAGAAG